MSSPLRTEQLTKVFPCVEALHNLTIDVPEGSVFTLMGANGAGKTTAIKTVLNIHSPTSGWAEVVGTDSRSLAAHQFAQIGYVSENQQIPGWMTVGYFLSYARNFYPHWRDEDAAELVRLYELPLNRTLNALSRGMRLKAMLAAALAFRPRLIVLDEPFSGLDVLVREQLVESILARTPEATVFLASHDLAEIESFATHIAYLNAGRLAFVDEIGTLLDRFREIEITLDVARDLPTELPSNWLLPDQSGAVVRFVDSHFDADRTPAEIRRRFPAPREVMARAMPLRSIALALAKSAKTLEASK